MKYQIRLQTSDRPSLETVRTETLADGSERTSKPPLLNKKVETVIRDALKESGELR